ncbi:hypothetical protein [Paraliomyxa miuraensis]|uniref:hypothetical protein n=1 Tax=Paraliomyxa miuraensis TaxID=376150 RepID=UPI002259E1CA|nr:hypothetical protein [Paraliomyxa miuraensis]MCX4245243.1 hypothetical protein [Paraliomyxa miuraensis]
MRWSISSWWVPSRWATSCLVLAIAASVTGCRDEDDGPYCKWVEEDVPLDYSLGPWGGDLSYDLQPGKILELITVPMQGTLTWNGGGNWASMTPSEGTTGFSSWLVHDGTTVYRRVPGVEYRRGDGGDVSLACPNAFDFGATIHLRTDDGVLDEAWETVVSFGIAAGNVGTEIDAEDSGIIEKLQIIPNPDPPEPFDNESYYFRLGYGVYPLSPELPTKTSGNLYFRGEFEPTRDGAIMEHSGFNRLLMEWVGSASG